MLEKSGIWSINLERALAKSNSPLSFWMEARCAR